MIKLKTILANKMASPKIELINHFDELINRVDIEFDECLQKFNEEHVLGDLKCTEDKYMTWKFQLIVKFCFTFLFLSEID